MHLLHCSTCGSIVNFKLEQIPTQPTGPGLLCLCHGFNFLLHIAEQFDWKINHRVWPTGIITYLKYTFGSASSKLVNPKSQRIT